ncbi:hypothetical protein RDI58_027238 [Solanum bulbocastanum]|uniref:Uncharacterized protein n=1 Tax=Solanum bulbocastanum TaxID=147425 RepID=A0AAN8T0E2_SOLBU
MATKRLRNTRNYSENVRNSILDRRETSLFKKEEQISKLEKINEEKEMKLLFNQLVEGKSINEVDAR